MKTLNSWCRGAIDKTTTLQVNFTGFNSRWRKFFRFFVLVVLFLFPLFVLFFFFFFNHTVKFAKISPGTYMFQRPFLRGLCMEGNLCFKTGQAYTWRETCISKSIWLAYSWKEILIYLSNLQKGFTKTRLEDVDLSKMQPCKYFVYMERGNPTQQCRVKYANSN